LSTFADKVEEIYRKMKSIEEVVEKLGRVEKAVLYRFRSPPPPPIDEYWVPHCFWGGNVYGKPPTSIKPLDVVELLSFRGAGFLYDTLMRVTMPDATPPDVAFIIYIDGWEIVDWTLEEYKNLIGFTPPVAGYGGVSIYDTTLRRYAGGTFWEWPFNDHLRVCLANYTSVEVTLDVWSMQVYSFAKLPRAPIFPKPG
jgi:hypothetical protein